MLHWLAAFLFLGHLIYASKWNNVSISQEQYDQLSTIVHYAKVAYCVNDTNSDFTTGLFENECEVNSWCTSHPEVEIVLALRPESVNGSGSGYVAVDHANEMVYVVFRGSQTKSDWSADFSFSSCHYSPVVGTELTKTNFSIDATAAEVNKAVEKYGDPDLCDGCTVHCGLYIGVMNFMDEVYEAAEEFLEQGYNLTVTGHSLGGGYAPFAALEFKLQGYEPLLVTYAALRQGNQAFNSFVDFVFESIHHSKAIANGDVLPFGSYGRVFGAQDAIPLLPPAANFTHGGMQFEIFSDELPTNISEVKFEGPSDNFAYTNLTEVMKLWNSPGYDLWANHGAYFIKMGSPCSSSS